ncbi:MAG: sugar O-acetyltransferase [Flavobacterium sp.]|nr:sugar O-acetyltransferase [Flavobacterium sp.]
MLAGELYDAFDAELLGERQAAKELCFQFNSKSPVSQKEDRKTILQQLLQVEDAWIESPFHVDYGLHCKVGKKFYANHGCTILDCNVVTIGDNCMLAPHVCISAATHPLEVERRARGEEFTAPVTIGDNVWIGANATICPGVTLGNGVVVGAGAVVTKSFPDNVVVGGVPARILKQVPKQAGSTE